MCVCALFFSHRVVLQVKHTPARARTNTRSAHDFHFLLGHFIVFSVPFVFSYQFVHCCCWCNRWCCCCYLLATGCECSHSCALTSVNQVKIDIFMLVSCCVGMTAWRCCCCISTFTYRTYIHTHFDFNLMVIILQQHGGYLFFINSRALTHAHIKRESIK